MSQANDRTHLLVPRDEAEAILLERVWRAADIKADEVETNQELEHAREREKRWHDYNYDLLTRLFSKNEYADQYRSARIAQRSVEDRYFTPTTSNLAERLVRSIKSQISALRSIIERLNLIDEGPAPASSIENEVQNERNLELLIERFHRVVSQIRIRREARPTLDVKDEYDVQDLLHALLKIFFDDIRDEEWTPSYAGGSKRIDFLIPKLKIAVEVKKSRPTLNARKLGDELIIDIAHYQTRPQCRTLYCFVYDPDNHITNPHGLESDLSKKHDELTVRVMIMPRP
ncbi:MAG: hypothetical protein WB677_14780 [Xanthobacteraceae bacterium]